LEKVSLTTDGCPVEEGDLCQDVWPFAGGEKGRRMEDEGREDGKERKGKCFLDGLD